MSEQELRRRDAVDDFRGARRRAVIEDLLARLRGEPDDLLPFDEVWRRVGAQSLAAPTLHEIPVAAVVGSVGRYSDFTRHFLPRLPSDEARWATVEMLMRSGRDLPPIEVYALGGVYFVKDGNHRVSAARQLGISHLMALVSEVDLPLVLSPALAPGELIIAAEYAGFLMQTGLDQLRPGPDLRVTAPGAYQTLVTQIEQRRLQLAQREARAVGADEAAVWWYDQVYLPAVRLMGERGLLDAFPGRTATDLYVWVCQHQSALEAELSWPIGTAQAASDLAERSSPRVSYRVRRVGRQLIDALRPETVRPGPPPGAWRRAHPVDPAAGGLFRTILVPLNGQSDGWRALDQALVVARDEGSSLYGLHVLPGTGVGQERAVVLRQAFERRCAAARLRGRLSTATGPVASRICERARWADLVVMSLAYAPRPRPLARLRSGFRDLVQRCPQPLLAVPGAVSPLTRGLLAYDGSPRAREALLLATYLALRGGFALAVVTATRGGSTAATLAGARAYLEERGIDARYILEHGPADEAIFAAAAAHDANLIILGGYSFRPELEIVLGSTVDSVLRTSPMPVLICR